MIAEMGQMSNLESFGQSGLLSGLKTIVFVDNHDTQRSQELSPRVCVCVCLMFGWCSLSHKWDQKRRKQEIWWPKCTRPMQNKHPIGWVVWMDAKMGLLVHLESHHEELQVEHFFGPDFPGCERCKADLQVREIVFRAALRSCWVQSWNIHAWTPRHALPRKFLQKWQSESIYSSRAFPSATAKLKPRYLLATAFMLAHPYGYPQANQHDAWTVQVGDAMHNKKRPVVQLLTGDEFLPLQGLWSRCLKFKSFEDGKEM